MACHIRDEVLMLHFVDPDTFDCSLFAKCLAANPLDLKWLSPKPSNAIRIWLWRLLRHLVRSMLSESLGKFLGVKDLLLHPK